VILSCYIDERTEAILRRQSAETGRSIEDLAEAAIANAACDAARHNPLETEPRA